MSFSFFSHRIEDLGCCKVICHREFGRNVFVGTIFTDAHSSTGIVEDLFVELKLGLSKLEESSSKPKDISNPTNIV